MKKKIISIFLLLIIIASQIGPAVIATEDISMTLEQYLIKNGVDTDGDKKISDAEWAKVKNLYLDSDIKNVKEVEKAINLKSLDISGTDGFNTIDFSKLQNLESLSISYSNEVKNLDFYKISNTKNLKSLYINYNGDIKNLDFSKLIQLKELSIVCNGEENKNVIKLPAMQRLEDLHCRYIYDLDISELSNLDILEIRGCTNIKLPKFDKLKVLAIYGNFNIDGIIDLQSCEEIEGDIYSEIGIEKIKLNENTMITKGSTYLSLENLEDEINIELNKNYELGNGKETYKLVRNENDNVAIFNSYVSNDTNYVEIKAKNIGTTNMTVKDILGREKTIKVNVYEPKTNNVDTKLENTGITAKFIEYNIILKSNGELWKINSSTTAEKVDTNVKAYKTMYSAFNYDDMSRDEYFDINAKIYDESGSGYGLDFDTMNVELTLKNDNSLNIKYDPLYHYEDNIYKTKKIPNVQAIGNNSYLTTDGKVYKININYITEELKTELIKENVKKLLDDCIVLNDGTTWYIDKYNGKYECGKLADFEIIATGIFAYYISIVVDKENNLWACKETDGFDSNGLRLLRKNSEWKKKEEYRFWV